MKFFTIGVFNSTEKEFFDKLVENRIDTFCDIRQRRGVRGSKYAFVNSTRLQEKLSGLGLQYAYVDGLAPTPEIRQVQTQIDLKKHESKTERKQLDTTFAAAYKKGILNKFDFKSFFELLSRMGSKRIVLFCVEETANACHRSLVAERLHHDFHFAVTHL